MGVGEYFGELALLYAAPRSASIKALEDCKFWCLSQSSFKKTLQNMVKQNYHTAKSYMSKISAFDFLTDSQKDAIAYNMHNLRY
jgi:cGMP-dependent protein kinase 1